MPSTPPPRSSSAARAAAAADNGLLSTVAPAHGRVDERLVFLAGHLSDRFGHLRLIAPAVLLNVLAGLVFLSSTDLGLLLVARVVSGLGVGMLVAGILADVAPEPLRTPYLVLMFAMLVGLLLVTPVPETVEGVDEPWHYRPQRVAVPAGSRGPYAGALLAGFVSFAMFGLFSALAASFLAGELSISSHAVAGLVTFAVFGASLAQIGTGRLHAGTQHTLGVAFLTVGLVLIVTAMLATAFPLFVVGGIVTGAGAGTLFKAGIGTVVAVAASRSRAEALAGMFLASYVGMSVPVVLLGVLMRAVPAPAAVLVFGVLMLVLLVLATLLRAGRRQSADAV